MNLSLFSDASAPDADEQARLTALYQYGLLDTAPEPAFDRLTAIVAEHFGAQIALISFIDDSRQWIKSAVGFGEPSVPRSESICSLMLQREGVLALRDAKAEPGIQEFSCVSVEGGVRFYAGAPLG